MVLSLETPVPFATEGRVIAEAKIALQVEVPLPILAIKVARRSRHPTVQLELGLGVVELLFLGRARRTCNQTHKQSQGPYTQRRQLHVEASTHRERALRIVRE